MKSNICLVGFMGTGKTRAGRIVAERTGKRLVEVDALIEKNAKKSIPEIFSKDGEIRFRELEIAAIKEASSMENAVFSLGGGAVLNSINVLYMRRTSVVICLTASPFTLYSRLDKEERDKRPLLANVLETERLMEIERLLAARAPFYAAATSLVVDTSNLSIGEVAKQILALFDQKKDA
jgi:shikimate kinase